MLLYLIPTELNRPEAMVMPTVRDIKAWIELMITMAEDPRMAYQFICDYCYVEKVEAETQTQH